MVYQDGYVVPHKQGPVILTVRRESCDATAFKVRDQTLLTALQFNR